MLYEWWERYRKLVISCGILLLIAISFFLYPDWSQEAPALPLETPAYALETGSGTESGSSEATAAEEGGASEQQSAAADHNEPNRPAEEQDANAAAIFVDVKGSVKQPGLYHFGPRERIFDAIAKAGGALPEADLNQINLAQPLVDGSVVWVPAKGEKSASSCNCAEAMYAGSSASPAASPQTAAGQQQAAASRSASPASSGKVNLNTATLQELMTLPGIGETRAKAIVAYREKNGMFQSPDQLKKVAGIGDKTYDRLKSQITIK